ncbi:MAG: type III-B CRISPR-associated protein Cas10/Cmr2 [Candidatus Contendobacter sp.]|nr:type III-B CRISPR-associated protein Cas10/Cmr2 [Candidatus Contendobacter sp.]MDG4557001.1 type III-B CRISPR-associated protein Cas10/Cmr2 [Candidatus Contendobacter sp.]
MSHLLMLNFGPVQGFIAAARRTRDLWFGSYLLSEVSKAAANALHQAGARLIFPAPRTTDDLDPDSDLNVANQLLAELPVGDPPTVLRQARIAAENRWKDLAEFAFGHAGLAHLREDVWQRQRDDVLECTAAWVTAEEVGYSPALAALWRLAAARKNTRDFLPAALTGTRAEKGYGLPKSSLDGLRETVLRETLPARVRRRLGLGVGEQLDCPGLVKRLCGGDPARFTPISRIALDPWLRVISADRLDAVNAACETLISLDWVTRVKGNGGIYNALPYDGQLLYPSRLDTARRECQTEEPAERESALAALETLHAAVKPLWRDYGEPPPYVALLLADGDRMGVLLDQADDAETHRAISAGLARFAAAVPDLVRDHRGHCIYSGGDDVLALLPLDQVLACARALHDRFGKELKDIADAIGAGRPTLSVGIALQHVLEPLDRFRQLAQAAERLAKGDSLPEAEQRDGLAIIVQTRSGAAVKYRERWNRKPDDQFNEWTVLYAQGQLPDKTAYELRRLADDLAWAPYELGAAKARELVKAEAQRVLARKQGDTGKAVPPAVQEALVQQAQDLGLPRLAQGLLIARWLAQRTAPD